MPPTVPTERLLPRHTRSISSMQWVSTFASGASSLGRPRRLAGHPAESGPPSSRGRFGENSPHIYKEHPEGKNGEKIFRSVSEPILLRARGFKQLSPQRAQIGADFWIGKREYTAIPISRFKEVIRSVEFRVLFATN